MGSQHAQARQNSTVFVANHLGTVSKQDEQELQLLPSFWRQTLKL